MSRGYAFEKYIVNNFSTNGWQCRRLGGSSTGLPDEVAVNNESSTLLTIEAKSTIGDRTNIEYKQIHRCITICNMFSVYNNRYVVFAFKFSGIKKDRKLKYYFFKFDTDTVSEMESVVCNYNGILKIKNMNGFSSVITVSYKTIDDLKSSV